MSDFHKTPMGKKYYEYDLPRLIDSQNRLAAAIEKQNKLAEKNSRKPNLPPSTINGKPVSQDEMQNFLRGIKQSKEKNI